MDTLGKKLREVGGGDGSLKDAFEVAFTVISI